MAVVKTAVEAKEGAAVYGGGSNIIEWRCGFDGTREAATNNNEFQLGSRNTRIGAHRLAKSKQH